MNIIELNHIDLNSIGLNSKVINGVGKPHDGKVKPYIKGHVTNGASTFTFKVNNVDVTVPVDANGNWKWVVDRTVTSLANAFVDNKTIDSVVVCGLNDIENMNQLCGKYVSGSTQTSSIRSFVFKNCDLSKCTKMQYAFTNCTNFEEFIYPDSLQPSNVLYGYLDRTKIDSIKASFFTRLGNWNALLTNNTYVKELDLTLCENPTSMNYSFQNVETIYLNTLPSTFNPNNGNYSFKSLKNLSINALEVDLSFKHCQSLTVQSVVNLFNAVAADGITLTFHATVYAMIEQQLEIEGSPIYEAYWNSDYDFNYASA